MVAGFQVPVIFSIDAAGSAGAVAFWHNGPIVAKVGVTWVAMVTLSVAAVAHCPASGVKVYTVVPSVAVETVAGFQVPVTFSIDAAGSAGAVEF